MQAKGTSTHKRASFANVTSVLALVIALGGTSVYAANTIGAGDIKRNAVRSKHIKKNNVKRADIARNAVNGRRIASGAVASSDLKNEAVGAADLATGSVGGLEILDGSVGDAELGVVPVWSDVTLAAGWTTFSGNSPANYHFGPVQCYRDPFGIVHLRGAAETSETNPGVVGVLPPECRVIPESSTPEANPYAEFAVVRLNEDGFSAGAIAAYVGFDPTQNEQNALGEDDEGSFTAGAGVAFDGVAIGAR